MSGYGVTAQGISCSDGGMVELDNSSECEAAIPDIRDGQQDTRWPRLVNFNGAWYFHGLPAGCDYTSNGVFWNTNSKGGSCSSCRSVCKGRYAHIVIVISAILHITSD